MFYTLAQDTLNLHFQLGQIVTFISRLKVFLSLLKYELIRCVKILKHYAMSVIIVYMYIDIYRGPQGRIAYVLIVIPSKIMYK